MKRIIFLIVMLTGVFINVLSAQNSISGREYTMQEEDTTYVIKKYFLCIYILGTNNKQSGEEALDLQVAHLEYTNLLTKTSKIRLSGPLETGADGRMREVLIFDTETEAEAKALACQDPMVRISRLDFEIIPWWATKGACLY